MINLETLTVREFAPLPYAYDALEPYIDAKTMELHHDAHHATYVNNLAKALATYPGLEFEPVAAILKDLNKVPEPIRTTVRNNGGGHINHTLFWDIMGRTTSTTPRDAIAHALKAHFGSFEAFKQELNTKATGIFGSGWAWLVIDAAGKLQITTSANQDSPYMTDATPILGLDVWEHAYYLHYQNKRASYIEAWWNVVNWNAIEERYRHITNQQ